jgi:hypothetical protein
MSLTRPLYFAVVLYRKLECGKMADGTVEASVHCAYRLLFACSHVGNPGRKEYFAALAHWPLRSCLFLQIHLCLSQMPVHRLPVAHPAKSNTEKRCQALLFPVVGAHSLA